MLIGFYKEDNPLKNTRRERLIALSNEARRVGDQLVIFSLKNVDFSQKRIAGHIYDGKIDGFLPLTTPFPDVIINEAPKLKKNRNVLEDNLRNQIPFTCFLIGNKFDLYNKIRSRGIFDSYLIPTEKLISVENFISFLNLHNVIILKPYNGRQGKGIYKIYIDAEEVIIDNNIEKKILAKEELKSFLTPFIEQKNYILQRFICAETKSGHSYDFRIHTQRNGEGKWSITKVYPRIGNEHSFLSNISQGGFTKELNKFLKEELGDKAELYNFILHQLSLDLSEHIDSFYNFTIDELGIDLAIDNNGEIWFYEANAGPQSKHHEEERAVNTIAYAKYLGMTAYKKENNTFLDKQENKITIGMLTGRKNVTYFTQAAVAATKLYDAELFYFNPESVNVESKQITGKFFDGENWVEKIYAYEEVHVIYDRFRKINSAKYKPLYKALSCFPITHKSFGRSLNKLELYKKFSSNTASYLIPFKEIKNAEDILFFVKEHKEVILKPVAASQGKNVEYLSYSDDTYVIKDKDVTFKFNQQEFTEYVTDALERNGIVAQKFIHSRTIENQPFDIRVHVTRGAKGKWHFASLYPRIGYHYEKISGTGSGGYIGNLDGFLKRHYPENHLKIIKKIKTLSLELVNEFEKMYNTELSEAGLDLILDKEGNVYLLEINVHQPGIIYYEFHLTKHMIAYAIHLAKQSMEKQNYALLKV